MIEVLIYYDEDLEPFETRFPAIPRVGDEILVDLCSSDGYAGVLEGVIEKIMWSAVPQHMSWGSIDVGPMHLAVSVKATNIPTCIDQK